MSLRACKRGSSSGFSLCSSIVRSQSINVKCYTVDAGMGRWLELIFLYKCIQNEILIGVQKIFRNQNVLVGTLLSDLCGFIKPEVRLYYIEDYPDMTSYTY